MSIPSDLDIAQSAQLVHINQIAEQMGLDPDTDLEHYGKHEYEFDAVYSESLAKN